METAWREPIVFTAGDTLLFKRAIGAYPASQGFALHYDIRGQGQPISFDSTADGDAHSLTVSALDTSAWLPGECEMFGFAVNGDQRFQVYQGQIEIRQNVDSGQPNEPDKTHAQKMVEIIETVMLAQAGNPLAQSQVGESNFRYLSPEQLRTEHGYWKLVRLNEIAKERAAAGLPTGTKTKTVFNIVPTSGFGFGGVRL